MIRGTSEGTYLRIVMKRRLSLDSQDRGSAADDQTERVADAGLRTLFAKARDLIEALRAGADETVLAMRVGSYMRSAVAEGISHDRIRAALVFLVREHGRLGTGEGSKSTDLASRDAAHARISALVERLMTTATLEEGVDRRAQGA